MKVGDLVKHARSSLGLGIVIGWYDSVHGYVIVRWRTEENPYHISKLILVSRIDMEKNSGVSVK